MGWALCFPAPCLRSEAATSHADMKAAARVLPSLKDLVLHFLLHPLLYPCSSLALQAPPLLIDLIIHKVRLYGLPLIFHSSQLRWATKPQQCTQCWSKYQSANYQNIRMLEAFAILNWKSVPVGPTAPRDPSCRDAGTMLSTRARAARGV